MSRCLLILCIFCFFTCKDKEYINPLPTVPEVAQFKIKIQQIFSGKQFYQVGTFDSISPNQSISFPIYAPLGSKFFFISKLKESYDLFYAPVAKGGIPLYINNVPVSTQEVNTQVKLWDCGISLNKGSNVLVPDTIKKIMQLGVYKDGLFYPESNRVMSIKVDYISDIQFLVTITNKGETADLVNGKAEISLGKGLFVIQSETSLPIFEENKESSASLKDFIAKGNISSIKNDLASLIYDNNPYIPNISKGVWLVHNALSKPLFTTNSRYSLYNKGLDEMIIQKNYTSIKTFLDSATGVRYNGFFDPLENNGDLENPRSTEFTITAMQGDRFSIAAKVDSSTDEFIAFNDSGINLWNNQGKKVQGDVSSNLILYDLGIEKNRFPVEDVKDTLKAVVKPVISNGYKWPSAFAIMRVTITPL